VGWPHTTESLVGEGRECLGEVYPCWASGSEPKTCQYNPTATLLEHTLLTQGFMSTSKAVSLIAGDRKTVILRGQFWATHSSVAVGISRIRPCVARRPARRTTTKPGTGGAFSGMQCCARTLDKERAVRKRRGTPWQRVCRNAHDHRMLCSGAPVG